MISKNFARRLDEALEGQELDWVTYFINPKDEKACQQADADWGHGSSTIWMHYESCGTFFSLWGPNRVPDIQDYYIGGRKGSELVDVSETLNDDEVFDLVDNLYRDPKFSAARQAAERYRAATGIVKKSYVVFGSGKVRV